MRSFQKVKKKMKQRMPHFTSQKPTSMGIPLRRLLKHGICFKKEKKQGGTSTSGQPKQQVSPFSLQQKEKKRKKICRLSFILVAFTIFLSSRDLSSKAGKK